MGGFKKCKSAFFRLEGVFESVSSVVLAPQEFIGDPQSVAGVSSTISIEA